MLHSLTSQVYIRPRSFAAPRPSLSFLSVAKNLEGRVLLEDDTGGFDYVLIIHRAARVICRLLAEKKIKKRAAKRLDITQNSHSSVSSKSNCDSYCVSSSTSSGTLSFLYLNHITAKKSGKNKKWKTMTKNITLIIFMITSQTNITV